VIALNKDHAARDAAFEQTQSWSFVRVVRLIPVCCGNAMVQIGEGAGRRRYYRCKVCKRTANGQTTREKLP
jgi:tRNA(Ile2) C34 agmatinyltransferase TiaS